MGQLRWSEYVPLSTFQAHPFLNSNSFCFVSGNLWLKKKVKSKTNLMLFQLNLIHNWSSDTVITSPPCSCYKQSHINKHNKYCQKNKNKTGQTKNPELRGWARMDVRFVCLPCDSLDELEIYNTGFYSKPHQKNCNSSSPFSPVVGRHALPLWVNSIKMNSIWTSAVIIM